jgi:hypothetical protein
VLNGAVLNGAVLNVVALNVAVLNVAVLNVAVRIAAQKLGAGPIRTVGRRTRASPKRPLRAVKGADPVSVGCVLE